MRQLAILTLVMLLAALPAAARGPEMMKFADELKLTDQQKEQLKSTGLQYQKSMIPKQAELKLAQLEMREIMMQNTVDEKAALANHDKISAIKAEISKMKLQNKLAMRKILTADQLEKWQGLQGRGGQRDDCCQGRGNRFGGKMGPMHGQPMGPGFGPGRGSQMGPE